VDFWSSCCALKGLAFSTVHFTVPKDYSSFTFLSNFKVSDPEVVFTSRTLQVIMRRLNTQSAAVKKKVKLSRYTPCRHMGGEEV
jgi:hypothetical protein